MYTPNIPKPRVLSVSQLNYYIKSVLQHDPRLSGLLLSGEISNLTDHYSSGHVYFSLKDEQSVIRAVMFSRNASSLRFRPQNGMKVICRGYVSLYEPSGQYQFYVEDMQPDGVGALALAFEQLKQKLEKQGMFDPARKKPLPRFPKTVGVITSPTGAAIRDIRNILFRRYPCADVLFCPVLVQGEGAPPQLVDAVKKLDASRLCDVIIIGRGGGSAEDLWAFNSEELAYAIFGCRTPVISAVGHETDFTICDFVSDRRAPTPSAAAELAVPDLAELNAYFRGQRRYLSSLMDSRFRGEDNALLRFSKRLDEVGPLARYRRRMEKYRLNAKSLENILHHKYSELELKLHQNAAKLDSLNPLSVLGRGYTMTEQDGKIVSTAAALDKNKEFSVVFSDAKITAKVTGE